MFRKIFLQLREFVLNHRSINIWNLFMYFFQVERCTTCVFGTSSVRSYLTLLRYLVLDVSVFVFLLPGPVFGPLR